jgi:NAD(P)H-dependent FMN reductase
MIKRELPMTHRILVFYGSYRSDRKGIRLANFLVKELSDRSMNVELIDAQAVGLPMLDRMYKEYPKGFAPKALEELAQKIREADAFVFVTGEYNWGPQPGLKNLTDHFLEEWFWRPAAIASYSATRIGGARSNVIWHGILSEMGMVVISSSIIVDRTEKTLDENAKPIGEGGEHLKKAVPNFADDLLWWTEAAKSQRAKRSPPY